MRNPKVWLARLFAGLLFAWTAGPAQAWLPFDGDSKWGAPATGSGAVVTWSLIPDGTGMIPYDPPDTLGFLYEDLWTGTSSLASVHAQLDGDPVVGAALFRQALLAAFDTWAAAADLQFVEVADDGSPLGFAGPTAGRVGDIRIGAFVSFACCGAHAFEPPGGSSPLAQLWRNTGVETDFGDVNLNAAAFFSVHPGLGEGDDFGGWPNDLQGLLTHEIGHALGLRHPEDDGIQGDEAQSIMYVGPGCCTTIHRQLGADDIAGIQFLYGAPPPVPEPAPWLLLAGGLAALRWRASLRPPAAR